jgi:hypothetical protein
MILNKYKLPIFWYVKISNWLWNRIE